MVHWLNFIQPGSNPVGACAGLSRQPSLLRWWILFLLYGRAHTSLTERWQVLFSRYSYLLVCEPSGFPVNAKIRPGKRYQGTPLGMRLSQRDMAQRKNNRQVYSNSRTNKSSQNGPGRELHGAIWEGPYSKTATGQKDLEYRRGPYLRGPADDVTLHQYGTCDICQCFSDVFYVTAPATIVCLCERQFRCCAFKPQHGQA